jgi:hypothetical protein
MLQTTNTPVNDTPENEHKQPGRPPGSKTLGRPKKNKK